MREGAPASYRVSKQRSERKPAGRSLRTLGPLKMQYGCNATHAFEPGQSGNPAGKPKGARNKTTLAVEALLDGEAETLTRKAIELAKAGDLAALRVCLDRIAPPRKDRPVLFELPPISSAADAAIAAAALLEAVAVGDLTPAEASELGKLIEAYVKALEATDFAERLSKLERMTNR
jgi:Family of unknown function (DUF5681)